MQINVVLSVLEHYLSGNFYYKILITGAICNHYKCTPDSQNYFNTNVGISSLPLKSINFSLDQEKTGLFHAKHSTLLFAYNIKIILKNVRKQILCMN